MHRYILCDLENIHFIGLNGIEHSTQGTTVMILYSDNCRTLRIETFEKIRQSKADVKFIKTVSTGANALDFQLTLLLGNLIGQAEASEFYVVSGDKDYQHGIRFANTYMNNVAIRITQVDSIQSIIFEDATKIITDTNDDEYLFLAK